jgi:hypothetical protein
VSQPHFFYALELLGKIEAEAEKIAASRGTAAQRIRNLFGTVEKTHTKQYVFDRKLHDLIEAAITENWVIMVMRRHMDRMTAILEQIIADGMASGEFPAGDTALAARLVNQLESIFAKTNTHCLSELVERLLQVEDDPPDDAR